MAEKDKTIARTVGQNLRDARKAAGYTQREVAALLGKYQSDYSDYETGATQLDYEKIVFLCNLFAVSPSDIFDGLTDVGG